MSSHQQVKFEPFEQSPANSLTDSFASTPGTNYPSLFDSPPMPSLDAFTPGSFDDEYDESIESTPAPEPAEKKPPVKKRKSWGQQLPEPKTNLPPRKRAKTEDEKEQRRVERVLRNRRAAQSSRERKRLEVEGLEKEKRAIEDRNRELELRLQDMEMRNNQLQQQLAAMSNGDMNVFRNSSTGSSYSTNHPQTPLRNTGNVTFSPELFGSSDSQRNMSTSTQYSVQTSPHTMRTVNPASLSPELGAIDQSNASSSDMIQHPAVSVGRASLDGVFAPQQQYFGSSVSSNGFGSYPHTDIDYVNGHSSFDTSMPLTEDGFTSTADNFNSEFDYMVSHNTSYLDLDNFLRHDDNSSRHVPEIRTSDTYVEKTHSLQSPIGASSFGCDAGSNAVSV